jgi:large subunit ribosomal protein L7/L12
MSEKLNAIVEELSQLTVMEACDLAKKLEEAWGVSATVPVVMPAAGEAVQEKSTVAITLTGYGEKKINVIKAIKGMLGLGLMESKNFVENLPKEVKAEISKEEAEKIKKELEEAGGTVEIK